MHIHPRCHLVLQQCCTLKRDAITSPTTNVCLHVASYLTDVFRCALGGPFGDSLSTGIPASPALCKCASTVTSSSTV